MGQLAWTRLVPHARSTDLAAGLAAEAADPLWLLGRQLQFGELAGSDGGSPVHVDVHTSWSRFTRVRAEGSDAQGSGATPVDQPVRGPVEAMVEREPELVPGDRGAWRPRLLAGRDLARRLRVAGLGALADALRTDPATTFTVPDPLTEDPVTAADRRYRTLLASQAIDGGRVLALLDSGGLPAELVDDLPAADRQRLDQQVLPEWREAMDATWGIADRPGGDPPAWVADRLEHAFTLAAPPLPGTGTPLVFRAPEYDGTGLDWYSLDLVPEPGGSDSDPPTEDGTTGQQLRSVLATPLTFPGAPSDRFWELEDRAVALSTTSAGRTSLARLVATEFALVYSPDWLLAPLDLPLGCAAVVDWVVVRDTFGVATLVGDRRSHQVDGVGRQFQPSTAGAGRGDHPLLVVPPAALSPVLSPPRELVTFQRDELANLAWAVEQVVAGASGRPVPQAWSLSDPEPPAGTGAATDRYELIWRLATAVPAAWIPLVPRLVAPDGPRVLRKAGLRDPVEGLRTARSTLLAGFCHLHDHELTGRGFQVQVRDRLARWHDGTSHAWRGREKRSGPGEVSSGLRYDDAVRPAVAVPSRSTPR